MRLSVQPALLLALSLALVACNDSGSGASGPPPSTDPYADLPSPQLLSVDVGGAQFGPVMLARAAARGHDALSPTERYVAFERSSPATVYYRDRQSTTVSTTTAPWSIPGVTAGSGIFSRVDDSRTIYSGDFTRAITRTVTGDGSFDTFNPCNEIYDISDYYYAGIADATWSTSQYFQYGHCNPLQHVWISGAGAQPLVRGFDVAAGTIWLYKFDVTQDPWIAYTYNTTISSEHRQSARVLDRDKGCYVSFNNMLMPGALMTTVSDPWTLILYNVCTMTKVGEFRYLDPTTLARTDARYASFEAVSDDGRYLVVVATPGVVNFPTFDGADTPNQAATYVMNMGTGSYTAVVTEDNGIPGRASISRDGRWIFVSTRKALVPADTNGTNMDVYAIRNPIYTAP